MNKQMIDNLMSAFGPSGYEDKVREVIKSYIEPYCDDVYTDVLGNLIGHKKGISGKKIMLSAHMDQIGFIITAIEEKGYLRVANVGGINLAISNAREVIFENGVKGVLYTNMKYDHSAPVFNDLYVDIGCYSKEEAEKYVGVGDMCVYKTECFQMGNCITSGNLDNRISCYCLIEALMGCESQHDLYFVFTVQEEVGLRGAGAAAYRIDPDLNINMDVTLTGDQPGIRKMDVVCGGGVTVKIMDSSLIVNRSVRDFMIEVAEENGIKFQREVLYAGGTDTAAVQKTKSGILAGCLSLPCRYVHSPVETVDINDIDAGIELLKALVKEEYLPENF